MGRRICVIDVSDGDVSGMNIAYLLSTFICRILDGISLNPFNAIRSDRLNVSNTLNGFNLSSVSTELTYA